jgi:hypothetical protein
MPEPDLFFMGCIQIISDHYESFKISGVINDDVNQGGGMQMKNPYFCIPVYDLSHFNIDFIWEDPTFLISLSLA